jgi:pimeloyl-ACP methyl ester carboxylesterase
VSAASRRRDEWFVTVSGRRLRIRVHGDGPPLLLINGLGANVATWTPLIDRLPEFKVISFDAPGTGLSQTPSVPYKVAKIVEVARRVLDAAGVERADVLGYSLGGSVAQRLAYEEPQRVRRLVLVSSSCGIGGIPGSLRALLAVSTPARHYAKTAHRVTMRVVDLAPAEKASRPIRDEVKDWHHEAAPSLLGYALQMTAFTTFHSLPWLHDVVQPTLVMSGTEDRLMPMANSAVLAAYLGNARLHLVEGWGHYLLHDAASGAAATVADFLAADAVESSLAWQNADTVSCEDMGRFLRSAPRSAHPGYLTSKLIRGLCRPRTSGR